MAQDKLTFTLQVISRMKNKFDTSIYKWYSSAHLFPAHLLPTLLSLLHSPCIHCGIPVHLAYPLFRICSLCFSAFISSIILLGFHCTLACSPHWVDFGYPPGFLVYSLIVLFNSFKYQEEINIENKFSKKYPKY